MTRSTTTACGAVPGHPGKAALGITAAAAVSMLLIFAAPAEYGVGVLLAVVNLWLVGIIVRVAWRKGRARATAAITFLPALAMSWPLGTIYFALVSPGSRYMTAEGSERYLYRASYVQWVTLIFLAFYGLTLLLMPLRWRHSAATPSVTEGYRSEKTEWYLVLVGLGSITAGWIGGLVGAGGAVMFAASALRNYFTGLLFLAGYRWSSYSRWRWVAVCVTVAACLGVNTVANSRGLAVAPLLMIALGVLLSERTTMRMRVALVCGGLVALPVYAVVGNQTRIVLNSIGFEQFGERARVLTAAASVGLRFENGDFASDTIGRVFSVGGHALITAVDTEPAAQRFDAAVFGRELALAFVPASLVDRGDWRYTGSGVLREHGFLVNDQTSVEVSLPGSLFSAGGLVLVALGACALACLNLLAFRAAELESSRGAALGRVGALVGVNVGVFHLDLIQGVRAFWWTAVYVTLAVWVARSARAMLRRVA